MMGGWEGDGPLGDILPGSQPSSFQMPGASKGADNPSSLVQREEDSGSQLVGWQSEDPGGGGPSASRLQVAAEAGRPVLSLTRG